MKPFRGTHETDMKQSRRSIGAIDEQRSSSHASEKFFLVLETLIKSRTDRVRTYSDGAPRVVSSSAHVPVVLPERSLKP